jgi:glucosamine--fructose-6-phosphate aminotransferase (isomerizing)
MSTWMRREVEQIPGAVARFLAEGTAEVEAAAAALRRRRPRFVSIVARGTSDHAATYGRYLVEATLGWPTGLAAASLVTVYDAPIRWRDAAVVAVSQSGGGPDVVAVTSAARADGALTIAVTNDPGSPLAAAAEHVLEVRAGEERSVAATKTYVGQLVAIAALVASAGRRDDLAKALMELPGVLAETVERAETWVDSTASPAAFLAEHDRAIVVSRGFNLATALEIGLKLTETAGLFALGYSTADLLHGPIVLAGEDVPLLAVRPDGAIGRSIDESLARARSLGSQPWVIGGAEAEAMPRSLVLAAGLAEALTPLAYVIPGQLLAESVARARGHDPDAPSGLTKVTRTR